MPVQYIVTIERKKRDSKLDAGFRWEVAVYDDPNNEGQNWELRGTGWCYTLKGTKKKALKHVLSCHNDIKEGLQYGVIFEVKGQVGEVEEALL